MKLKRQNDVDMYMEKLLVIPEIKIARGSCSDTVWADENSDYYKGVAVSPVEMVRLLRRENAKSVLIDICQDTIEEIGLLDDSKLLSELESATDIPLQLLLDPKIGITRAKKLISQISAGLVARIFVRMGSGFDESHLGFIEDLVEEFGSSKICISMEVDFLDNQIPHYIRSLISIGNELGLTRYMLITSTSLDKELISVLETFFNSNIKLSLKFPIRGYLDLKLLQDVSTKIDSVVIGSEFYENIFPCQQIWRNAEAHLDILGSEGELSSVNR
ncbi:MAG: hypothetical protein Kapaf2KO_03760 [Candidatus Kapaibacteriales bacterium]